MKVHQYQDLIRIFSECFELEYNTKLVCGDDEPLYRPADEHCSYHSIIFAHGFFSSGLHECAHWLIAGDARRTQVDYGYWYVPDGRTAEQQIEFQQVEVKPQALESILSSAAGYQFQFSIDNLNGMAQDTEQFKQAVYQQILTYETHGLPARATVFREALRRFYGGC